MLINTRLINIRLALATYNILRGLVKSGRYHTYIKLQKL